MRATRVPVWIVLVTSVVVFLSAFAHAFLGWPALRPELEGRVDPDVVGALGAGWHFGSVAMAAFGAIGILCALRMLRGETAFRLPPAVIGLAYILFGGGALVARGVNTHFLAFVLLGALLLGGAVAGRGVPARLP